MGLIDVVDAEQRSCKGKKPDPDRACANGRCYVGTEARSSSRKHAAEKPSRGEKPARKERLWLSSCLLLAFFESGFLAGSAVEIHEDFS